MVWKCSWCSSTLCHALGQVQCLLRRGYVCLISKSSATVISLANLAFYLIRMRSFLIVAYFHSCRVLTAVAIVLLSDLFPLISCLFLHSFCVTSASVILSVQLPLLSPLHIKSQNKVNSNYMLYQVLPSGSIQPDCN